jgi:hypothetical protein
VANGKLPSTVQSHFPTLDPQTLKQENTTQQAITAVIKQEGNLWIGWIEELPGVNCQEAQRDELIESLRDT